MFQNVISRIVDVPFLILIQTRRSLLDIIMVHPIKKLPSSQISDISHLMHVLKKLMQPNSVIFAEKGIYQSYTGWVRGHQHI